MLYYELATLWENKARALGKLTNHISMIPNVETLWIPFSFANNNDYDILFRREEREREFEEKQIKEMEIKQRREINRQVIYP